MALEKLLVTGASGVIGKVLIPKLAESYDVYSVDQNLTAVPGRLFKADLSDYEQIASVAISDLRIIVQLAANSTADATWQSVESGEGVKRCHRDFLVLDASEASYSSILD